MQPTLFDQPIPPRIEAFKKIEPKLPSSQERVLGIIQSRGKATIEDVCKSLQIEKHRVSGRLTELKKQGKIEIAGVDRSSGRALSIYKIAS